MINLCVRRLVSCAVIEDDCTPDQGIELYGSFPRDPSLVPRDPCLAPRDPSLAPSDPSPVPRDPSSVPRDTSLVPRDASLFPLLGIDTPV